jgi:DNA-binding CsgD family transcriptional regulator
VYNELMRPVGLENGIFVFATDGRIPVGSLMLFRGADEPGFSPGHFALLHALRGHFGHALRGKGDLSEFSDTEDEGVIITDHRANILHMSAQAHRLLLMATVPRWTPEAAARMRLGPPPEELARLCALLRAAWTPDASPAPPALWRRNNWGEFRLRAYWLNAVHPDETSRFVGINIQRREWQPLALHRKVEALALTDREKQLCLLLLRGGTTADMARIMGVSEHTVISHRRNLYGKLGVANRMELAIRVRVE